VVFGETLCAFGYEHHVGAILEDGAGEANGVADTLQGSDGAGPKVFAVHDDGVAFDAAIEIQVGAKAGIENGFVFQDKNGGFDSVESRAAARQDGPASVESGVAPGFASVDSFVWDIPRAAMNNE
jgi:hypothetical protein